MNTNEAVCRRFSFRAVSRFGTTLNRPALLTRQEILARWPEPHPPHPDSLWRSLTRGCELGLLVRTGAGTKAEAFRYGLAEGEPAT